MTKTLKKRKNELCGISCLYVVFNSFSKKINRNKENKKFANRKFGTWITDLGLMALNNGFDAKIITFSKNFKKEWFTNKKCIKENLRKQKIGKNEIAKSQITSMLKFIESGGIIEYKQVSKILILDFIKFTFPIVCIRTRYGGHFIVIKDAYKSEFTVFDPKRNVIKTRKIDKNKLMDNIHESGSWILAIKPSAKHLY